MWSEIVLSRIEFLYITFSKVFVCANSTNQISFLYILKILSLAHSWNELVQQHPLLMFCITSSLAIIDLCKLRKLLFVKKCYQHFVYLYKIQYLGLLWSYWHSIHKNFLKVYYYLACLVETKCISSVTEGWIRSWQPKARYFNTRCNVF